MTILLVYATYSGGTMLAGELIGKVLTEKGHAVIIRRVSEVSESDFTNKDLVIFGSNTWFEDKKDGQLNKGYDAVKTLLQNKKLSSQQFAIYGLGDKNYLHFCYAINYLQEFVKILEGKELVPALRVNQFYFHEKQNRDIVTLWANQIDQKLKSLLSSP